MERIKVAMLGPFLEKHDSLAIHVSKLVNSLSSMEDIELHIITIGNKDVEFKKDNSTLHVIKKPLKKMIYYPFCIPYLVWRLWRKIEEIKPKIIHAQGTTTPYSTAAALLCNKYPTLLTVRGIITKEFKFYSGLNFIFTALVERANERYVLSKIPNIIVTTPYSKDVVKNMTNSKVYVVPNGIDFDYIQNIRLEHRLNHPSVLFVGGLGKVKGIDILLKAVPIIGGKIPNLHLYIGGLGREEIKLRRLIKELKIEEKVKFLGFLSGEEKYAYYKSADIYVQPSRHETFGVALLEAMACGKPVVASNVGGIPFVVEDGVTGLLFECGDVEDLAGKVILLLRDEGLRNRMGEAGKKRAMEFTWGKVAEKTVEVYKEVIKIKNN